MIGLLVGAPLCGFVNEKFGPKRLCDLTALAFGTAVALVSLGNSVEVIMVGRFLKGQIISLRKQVHRKI